MKRARLGAYATPKKEMARPVYLAVSALVAVALFAAWGALAYGGFVRRDFLPTPYDVVLAAIEGVSDGSLLINTAYSVAEILTGFVLASIVAVPLGILMGSFKIIEAAIEPGTNFVRYFPVSALIPLLILCVCLRVEEKIAVILIGTMFQQIILLAAV